MSGKAGDSGMEQEQGKGPSAASSTPIGVFDSGMGGISVVRQLRRDMPDQDIIFFGDSANAPYGTRPISEVTDLSFAVADRLVKQGVKAIVIACNTATSACAPLLRRHYDIPIIGMEPALKVAIDRGQGKSQHVLVTATKLTLEGRKFAALMDRERGNNIIETQPCPDLVTLVEADDLGDRELVLSTIERYLRPFDLDSLDSIVLGCTHFVFYRRYFREILPDHVAIIDGNQGTSRHVQEVLGYQGKSAERAAGKGTVILQNSKTDPQTAALMQALLTEDLPN